MKLPTLSQPLVQLKVDLRLVILSIFRFSRNNKIQYG